MKHCYLMRICHALASRLRVAALLLAAPLAVQAQTGGVRMGTPGTPDPSAVLDLQPDAATAPKGFLPPRLTYAQRTAISNAAAGLLVYQSNASTSPAAPAGYYFYTGTQWLPLLSQGDNLGSHTATQSLNLNGNQVLNATRVGIGTATPALGIDVAGANAAIGVRGASWDHLYLTHDASTAFLNAGGAENGLALRVGNSSIGSYGGQSYAEGLRLLPNGNAGVGTATPSQKLEVAGQVFSSSGGFRFPDNTVQTTAAAADNLGNHTATQNLDLGANALVGNGGTAGVAISSTGRVGIGTTAPVAQLEVALPTASTQPSLKLEHRGSNVIVRPSPIGMGNSVIENTAGHLLLNPRRNNVGIGTSSPQAKLHVNGSAFVKNYDHQMRVSGASSDAYTWNHSLGYKPVLMLSIDGTGGSYSEYITCSYENIDDNNTVIRVYNHFTNIFAYSNFKIRWIMVGRYF